MAAEETIEEAMKYLQTDPAVRAKEAAKTFDGKKMVWVPTPPEDLSGYVMAEVTGTEGETNTVETANKEVKTFKKEQCEPVNPPKYEKCTDMANLTFLSEATILHNLRQRYEAGFIYTYSGLFCVAVNPYRRLPIYSDAVISLYRGKRRPEVPPHVFAIVDNAYQDMLTDHENQSMLITGESGAGKTENTKKVINYIAKVAGVEGGKKDAAEESAGGLKGTLDEQVVECNPLLEAFGNAKTTRNNNSSRFGKFIRCHFSNTGKLAGADIESYLLEKNRVIHQGAAERNYHIFYQILYATTDEELASYLLMSREAKDYGFLAKGVYHVDRIDDKEEWALTINAIKVLGFTEEEKVSMMKITASLLNFSNMKFKQKPRDEQAEIDDASDGERVSYLLGLQVGEFCKSLVKPKVKVGTEYVNKGQSVEQVLFAVSALAKALFERMFVWMVSRVNKALETKERRSYFIGVLDIAGFEIFDYNSFEQLCINLTNEKLQQFFNHTMFVLEQEEYTKEGIVWEFIDFGMDLAATIDLVEKPMGIFAMLEEECIVPKATDQTYLSKMHKELVKNPMYTKPSAKQTKSGGGDFILHHYAGSVGYSIENWLEKNKEPMNDHTASLFAKATDALVSHLFQDYNADKGAARKKGGACQTVSYRHKEQLKTLMTTLHSTSPHFVRCIIPNEKKQPGLIDGQLVLHQLRCNGVLEGIRICRKGFPSRMLFNDFKQRYSILAAAAVPTGFVDGKVAAGKLLEALQLEKTEYMLGNTKVFFRSGIVGELEEMRDERLGKIVAQFQAYCKANLMRLEFKKMLDQKVGLAVIQRNVRKFLMLRNWPWWNLYLKVQPMLSVVRAEEEMQEKEEQLKKALESSEANEKKRKELEEKVTDLMSEKEKLSKELQDESERLMTTEEKLMEIQTVKDQLEASLNEALEKLEGEEHGATVLSEKLKNAQAEIAELTKKGEEMTDNIAKLETEKKGRDKHIETLSADIAKFEENVAKLSKEKKNVEEQLNERTEQLQASEDKANQLNKAKANVESQLSDTEHQLQKEKEAKAKLDKEKKKVEGELKDNKEKLADTESELSTTKDTVAKKEKAIKELEEVKEGHETTIKQCQKKIQETLSRVSELEDEVENERKLAQKTELARKDLESQLEELQEQLEVQGGATNAQVEVSKKREAECAKLRAEIEEINAANNAAAASAKSKFNAALGEASEELENVKKAKAKTDKEKSALSSELQDVRSQFEKSKKQKTTSDKTIRSLEEQLNESRGRLEEAENGYSEAQNKITKATSEASNMAKLLAEAEHKLGLATKNNKTLESNLAEARQQAEDDARGKHELNQKLQHANADIERLTEQVEESESGRAVVQNKLAKLTAEFNSIKGKVVEEGAGKVEELEEAKRKLTARIAEMEEALSIAETKSAGMEKLKARMNEEVDDLLLDLEKAQSQASTLEKKQKKVDQQINEWKVKCDDVQKELDKAQKDARQYSSEVLKMRSANEDINERYESLKKENKSLTEDLMGINEKLNEGGKVSAEVEKVKRKYAAENEELQLALEEAEIHLEQESAKLLKLQLEYAQFKQLSERKIAEKEDENETTRKNHQRQLDSLQSTIDNELRAKGDLQKGRKKFESDLIELESKLESSERSSAESQKSVKKLTSQIKDLQAQLDDEGRRHDDMRDSITRAERRANDLAVQLDESRVALESTERARKLADSEKSDHIDRITELQGFYNNALSAKRKAENDYHGLYEEIEVLENNVKNAEDKAEKAMAEVARLMAELNGAHETALTSDKSRAMLARQVSQLQGQLETAEMSGGKGLKAQVRKMEARILELEGELDTQTRNSALVAKQARQAEKKIRDCESQVENERKANEQTQEAAEKLNSKMKKMRLQIEALEHDVTMWQSKYKKASSELEESEERSEAAETALSKARQAKRAERAIAVPSASGSRQRSRMRTPAAED